MSRQSSTKPTPQGGGLRRSAASSAAAVAGAAAADDEAAQLAPPEPAQRRDQHLVPLPARQAPRQHHHGEPVGQAPLARERDHALGRDALGIEALGVDAAVHDADARGIEVIGLDRVLGHEFRDRDDAFARAHHRIVAPLQRRAGAVGVVKSGDEVRARTFRRGRARSTPARGSARARCRCRGRRSPWRGARRWRA